MSDLTIRPAEVEDARAIADLHVRSFIKSYQHLATTRRAAEGGLEERVHLWESRLGEPAKTTLVAMRNDRMVGFIHIGPSPDKDADDSTGHIYSVHVDPSLTGGSIGSRLVARAMEVLAKEGFHTATLWAVSDNERARRFYDRLGWLPDGVVRSEKLSVGSEGGDVVEVSRFRHELSGSAGGR